MEKGAVPKGPNGCALQKLTHLEIAYQNAWQKFRKYYELTDVCPEIYSAALLFHPCYQRAYFDACWTGEFEVWKEHLLSLIKTIWETEYCESDAVDNADDRSTAKRAKCECSPDIIDCHMQAVYQDITTTGAIDDFNVYTKASRSCLSRS